MCPVMAISYMALITSNRGLGRNSPRVFYPPSTTTSALVLVNRGLSSDSGTQVISL